VAAQEAWTRERLAVQARGAGAGGAAAVAWQRAAACEQKTGGVSKT
jgi:hypothetical protein